MKLFGPGRDLGFYTLLEQQADAAVRAAQQLLALTRDYGNLDSYTRKIRDIEHEADDLTHELSTRTDSTFVTPLDKEDIHALSTELDDITDAIDDAAQMLALYRIPEQHQGVEPLVALLLQIVEATREVVFALRLKKGRDTLHPVLRKIHDLEHDGDDAYRRAISELFHSAPPEPLRFIAWKEIYDRIEGAVDKCEDVAKTAESLLVKYA